MLKKHRNNQDVAIEILKRFFVPEKQVWKLKVRWYRIYRNRPPMCMNIDQRITVARKDWAQWEIYREEKT